MRSVAAMKKTMLQILALFGLLAAREALSTAAIPTADAVATKWKNRTAGASQDYVDGVRNTDKDPTALAIAAGPRYLQRVQEAFNSGRWANGLRKSGKSGWVAGVEGKGAQNFVNGVNGAEDKVRTAFGPLLAFEASLQTEIGAMPNVTDNDRDARMLRWAQKMRTYKKNS